MIKQRAMDLSGCVASSLPYLQYSIISWNRLSTSQEKLPTTLIIKFSIETVPNTTINTHIYSPNERYQEMKMSLILLEINILNKIYFTYQLKKAIIEFEKIFRVFFFITIFKAVSSEFGCSV